MRLGGPAGRAGARAAFIVYAAALVTATHWPRLQVEGPAPRTDLWLHVGAFGLWALLLHATGWPGRPGTGAALRRTLAIGIGYGLLDEASQAIPAFGRVLDWTDALANAAGAAGGSVVGWRLARGRA